MKNKIKRIIFAILIILNCSLIFYFSNQVADDSSVQSSRVVDWVSEVLPSIRNLEETEKDSVKAMLVPIVRKTAHFSIYAMLGIWTINFALTFGKINMQQKIIYTILFCLFYAITDEIHQIFIEGRSCEIRDILIDTLGAATGTLIMLGIIKLIEKIFHKNEKELS